jgi:hypothetical protein
MSHQTTADRLAAPDAIDHPAGGRLRALLVAGGLLAAGALVIGGGFELAASLGLQEQFTLVYAVAGTLATLSLAGIALEYLKRSPVEVTIRLPRGREWAWILLGIGLPIAGSILLSVVADALGLTAGDASTNGIDRAAAANPALVYSLAILSALFIVAPAEELLYRGAIQGRLRMAFGPTIAIGVTALGFAAGHLFSYALGGSDPLSGAVVVSLASIAFGGVVLGVLYERTDNLVVPTVAHALSNALLLAVTLAMVL